MRSRFTKKHYGGYGARNRFAAEKVTVKVKEKNESEYRVYGRYSSAKAANEVASDLQNLCGYDVIVEY